MREVAGHGKHDGAPGGREADRVVDQIADHLPEPLAVADDGRGIAADRARRVFDRFFQADDARNRGDGARGGGLGLPICRSIVEWHGGTIVVTSPGPGKGTTVTVRLPLRTAA